MVGCAALLLIALWDLWAFAVWVAGLRGSEIVWRGHTMRLSPDGRLSPRSLTAGGHNGSIMVGCAGLPLIAPWDLWAFAVWMAGLRGSEIVWRGHTMRLSPDGRLSPRS